MFVKMKVSGFCFCRSRGALAGTLNIAVLLMTMAFAGCKREAGPDQNELKGIRYFNAGLSDKVNSISKTSDGGFVYCGYTGNNDNHTDAFLLKVDADGNKQWYKTFGGARYDEFYHVTQTSDGGYVAVGQTSSYGLGPTDNKFYLYDYTVRIDASGNEVWTKSMLPRDCMLMYVFENASHEIVATGSMITNGTYDIISMKYGLDGQLLSAYSYYPPYLPPQLASTSNWSDLGQYAGLSNDGELLLAGTMNLSAKTTEARKFVPWLMKLKMSDGNPTWFQPYYGIVSESEYRYSFDDPHYRRPPVKVCNVSDGYIIGTYIELPGVQFKMNVIKLNFNGELQWEKQYGGLGNALLHHIEANADGTFLLVGSSSRYAYDASLPERFYNLKTMLLKVDADGNEIWTSYTGAEANAHMSKCVAPLADGGWLVAGYTCLNQSGFDNMFYMRVDKNGKLVVD